MNEQHSDVKFVRVVRHGPRHSVKHYAVHSTWEGSALPAPEAQQQWVLARAEEHPPQSPLDFAQHLVEHSLAAWEGVEGSRVEVVETLWNRIKVDGTPHDCSFMAHGGAERVASASGGRDGLQVEGGWRQLRVMKTASEPVGPVGVNLRWRYRDVSGGNEADYPKVKNAVLEAFAGAGEAIGQATVQALGRAACRACPAMEWIQVAVSFQPYRAVSGAEVFREGEGAVEVVKGRVVASQVA